MPDKLDVYWELRHVGTLELSGTREFSFQYSRTWLEQPDARPISLSLPLGASPFGNNHAFPFFSNLLPEAAVREVLARRLGISQQNDFKLLEAIGGDCAGALSLFPAGTKPDSEGSYQPLPTEKLNKIISEMPERPLLSPNEGVRLSLAGVQNKLPIYCDAKGNFFLPRGIHASSHILKPPISHVKCSVENEVFIMTLAGKLGMSVSDVQVWPGTVPVFMTKRYDREQMGDDRLIRLHQEDFCQALSIGAGQKYEKEGGPTLKSCFELLDRHVSVPGRDKRRLIEWVIFNTIVGNNDAHGKNISLLWSKSEIALAPFYDLLSTSAYPSLSQELAMSVGGENRATWLRREHWENLARDAAVSPNAVFMVMEKLVEGFPAAIEAAEATVAKGPGDFSILRDIKSLINKSLIRLKETLAA